MKAFELIIELERLEHKTKQLAGYAWFNNNTKRHSSEISELIERINNNLDKVKYSSSKQP